jgi:RNA polymerase sigma-70 factor (ECF subfamily)
MPDAHPDTDQLLERTAAGDESAAQELLARCRPRLRRMVAVHLDRRIAGRVDPSDVVQEALAEAHQRLPEYVQERTMSFYPWLRRIAWQRLVKIRRRHLTAGRRSVRREEGADMLLPDESVEQLADQLASSGTEPGQRLVQEEIRQRVRTAIDELRPQDRELLVMRYLEHMSLKEISEAMEIALSTIRKRHTRAIERLERRLKGLS